MAGAFLKPLTMSYIEIIAAVISGGVLTKTIDYLFNLKKNKAGTRKEEAQAESLELDNVDKAVKIWRQLSEEQTKKVEQLQKKVDEMEACINNLEDYYKKKCDTCPYKLDRP